MFRIAIAGSHGVGKTTLGKMLQREMLSNHVDVSLISGIARNLISEGFPLGKEATQLSYIHYIMDQLSAEKMLQGHNFISDRTLLDPLSYAEVNRSILCSNNLDSTIELLRNVWSLESGIYDFYVFVPIEFPMVCDGVRPEDKMYQYRVEQQILNNLNLSGKRYVTVSGAPEQRCQQILDIISSYL